MRFSDPGTGEDQDLTIDDGDGFLIGDGYKHGLQQQLMMAFKPEGKTLEKHVWQNFH